jgi:hypothetical protein
MNLQVFAFQEAVVPKISVFRFSLSNEPDPDGQAVRNPSQRPWGRIPPTFPAP